MYNKVLVPLDGSKLAECVLPHVQAILRGCQPSRIILAQVVDGERLPIVSESWGPPLQAKLEEAREAAEASERSSAEEYLSGVKNRLNPNSSVEITTIEGEHVAETILDYAAANEIDLIIIASHGRSGVSRWLRGSVADRILHGGCLPILMVHAPGCGPVELPETA